MDGPTLAWLKRNVLPMDTTGKRVLEVGSLNVNGSIRATIESQEPALYWGVDIEPGPGVDEVISVHDLIKRFGAEKFDLVISTEMLEHVEDWRDALRNLKAVVKVGGTLILTTRRPGFPRHCHPHDHWRFTPRLLRRALDDWVSVKADAVPGQGVAVRAVKPIQHVGTDLSKLHPHPAPDDDMPRHLRPLWVLWAYRGHKPEAA